MFMEGHSKALYGIDFSPNGYVTIFCYRSFRNKGMKSRKMRGLCDIYQGADKSLARPGRKQATATEDFDVQVSSL